MYGTAPSGIIHLFVVAYEERALAKKFARDDAYGRQVGRWLPRL